MMLHPGISLLADLPAEYAQRMGILMGTAVFVFFCFAFGIFTLVAIIMAVVKRTTGWIVTAIVCGLPVVGWLALFVLGLVLAIMGKTGVSPGTNSAETITGKTVPYTIQKPAGWKVKRDQKSYDAELTNGTGFVGVIAEKADLGSNETAAKFIRKRFESIGTDLTLSDNQTFSLDGRTWIGFTARCKVMMIPFTYQVYVHSGKEGTFQVWEWSFQNLWDSELPGLNKIVQTVHLPSPGGGPAAGMTANAASLRVVTGVVMPFTIEAPAGWTLWRDVSGYDMLLGDSREYVAVSADRRNFGSTESYATSARQRISSVAFGTVLAANQPARIHDRPWTCFTASTNLQKQPYAYLCYVYSGPEGSVQLTGWAPQNDWAREGPILDRVMHSFRFPPAVASAARP